MTPESLNDAIRQVAGQANAPYTPPHLMQEAAGSGASIRQKAMRVVQELIANRDKEYARPLVQAAMAYVASMKATTPESKRHDLAKALLEEMDAHVKAAEATIKVLRQYSEIVSDAAGDHYNVAQTYG